MMNETLKEQISALVDDELPGAESELVLRRLRDEPELRRAYARYFLIGETVRHSARDVAPEGFSDRVQAALAQEGGTGASPEPGVEVGRRLRPAALFAAAASVAVIALVALQNFGPTEQPAPMTIVAEQAEPQEYVVPPAQDSLELPASRLADYLVSHASATGRQGVMSYRLVGYEPDPRGVEEPSSNQEDRARR